MAVLSVVAKVGNSYTTATTTNNGKSKGYEQKPRSGSGPNNFSAKKDGNSNIHVISNTNKGDQSFRSLPEENETPGGTGLVTRGVKNWDKDVGKVEETSYGVNNGGHKSSRAGVEEHLLTNGKPIPKPQPKPKPINLKVKEQKGKGYTKRNHKRSDLQPPKPTNQKLENHGKQQLNLEEDTDKSESLTYISPTKSEPTTNTNNAGERKLPLKTTVDEPPSIRNNLKSLRSPTARTKLPKPLKMNEREKRGDNKYLNQNNNIVGLHTPSRKRKKNGKVSLQEATEKNERVSYISIKNERHDKGRNLAESKYVLLMAFRFNTDIIQGR